jgi:hypothetical protein
MLIEVYGCESEHVSSSDNSVLLVFYGYLGRIPFWGGAIFTEVFTAPFMTEPCSKPLFFSIQFSAYPR